MEKQAAVIYPPIPKRRASAELEAWFAALDHTATASPETITAAWVDCKNWRRPTFARAEIPSCHPDARGVFEVRDMTISSICKACSGCALSPNILTTAYQQGSSVSEASDSAATSASLGGLPVSLRCNQPESNELARSLVSDSVSSDMTCSVSDLDNQSINLECYVSDNGTVVDQYFRSVDLVATVAGATSTKTFVLNGPQGCGKSTHADQLADLLGVTNMDQYWEAPAPLPANSLITTSDKDFATHPGTVTFNVADEAGIKALIKLLERPTC